MNDQPNWESIVYDGLARLVSVLHSACYLLRDGVRVNPHGEWQLNNVRDSDKVDPVNFWEMHLDLDSLTLGINKFEFKQLTFGNNNSITLLWFYAPQSKFRAFRHKATSVPLPISLCAGNIVLQRI